LFIIAIDIGNLYHWKQTLSGRSACTACTYASAVASRLQSRETKAREFYAYIHHVPLKVSDLHLPHALFANLNVPSSILLGQTRRFNVNKPKHV
jgi:molybdopterin-guanine dinucleotide biosynthesis protein A